MSLQLCQARSSDGLRTAASYISRNEQYTALKNEINERRNRWTQVAVRGIGG